MSLVRHWGTWEAARAEYGRIDAPEELVAAVADRVPV
jgi:hypothetical protein